MSSTQSMEEKMIAAIYKREPIWNPASVLYKNVGVLKKLWKQVSEEVNLEEKVVKMKWKNMRGYFFKQLKNMEKSNTPESIVQVTWPLYKQLWFLKDALEKYPNVRLTIDECELLDQLNETEKRDESQATDPIAYQHVDTTPFDSTEDESPPVKKFRSSNESSHVERTNEKEIDADLLYLQSLLPYMKEFPLIHKLRVRSRIQDLILEELEIVSGTQDALSATESQQSPSSYMVNGVESQSNQYSAVFVKEEKETEEGQVVVVKEEKETEE